MSDHHAGHDDVRTSIDITIRALAGGVVVVAPHGDVDLTTAPTVRESVGRLIDGGATALILDLTDVGFMDSSALGALVSFHRRLRDRFVVAGASPAVHRLLEITKFTSVLRLTDSVPTALTALRS